MTDLLFEIAKYDVDPYGKKVQYLNKVISDWKNNHSNSQDTSVKTSTSKESTKETPYSKPNVKHCYRCDDILTKEHIKNCPGFHSLCIHCNKKGHLRKCCGQLGYFPHKTK